VGGADVPHVDGGAGLPPVEVDRKIDLEAFRKQSHLPEFAQHLIFASKNVPGLRVRLRSRADRKDD